MGSKIRTGTLASNLLTHDDITSFVKSWLGCLLDNNEWTHQAHLVIGTWMIHQHKSVDAALDAMRPAIKAYNLANGQANTDTEGYHETATRFFLEAIAYLVSQQQNDVSLSDALTLVSQSDIKNSKLPFFFYSHNLFLSKEARLNWVAPDLRPLSDFTYLIKKDAGI